MDEVINAYFQIFSPDTFKLIFGLGISAILIYTVYSFFD